MSLFTKYPQLMDPEYSEVYGFAGCWTATHPEEAFEELDVAAAIIVTRGNISRAAKLLGRSRRSTHGHILRNRELAELLEDIIEAFIDEVETKYQEMALMGDGVARKFFLTTKGKSRGYVTRVETTGPNGGPIEEMTIDPKNMSDTALEELLRARDAAKSAQG